MARFFRAIRFRATIFLPAVLVVAGVSAPIGDDAVAATARDTTISNGAASSRSLLTALQGGAYRESFRVGSLSGADGSVPNPIRWWCRP